MDSANSTKRGKPLRHSVRVLLATAGAATKPKAAKATPTVRPVSSTENLVIHVPNPSNGEIHFMVGTREVVRHDRALVARLVRDVS